MSAAEERRKGFIDLEVRLGNLEGSVDLLTKICGKIDDTMDKIRDVTTDLTRIMATHEERLKHHEQATDDLVVSLDEHKKDDRTNFDTVIEKIDGLRTEIDGFKKWAYIIMGGGMVVIWVLETFWTKLFS